MSDLYVGFEETDITPSVSVEMIGFDRRDSLSHGVADRLLSQVAVFRLEETLGCVITVDHIGFSKEHSKKLRDQVAAALSITRQQVMLCFSHTHSAPNDSAEPEYYDFVCSQIQSAAQAAAVNTFPATAAWGNGCTSIGLNRRPGAEAIDQRIGILKICDRDSGTLKLLLLRLTAHANVLKVDNDRISPDYFGAVRHLLKEQYGCPVMVTQGASGNIAPRYFHSATTPPDAPDSRFLRREDALSQMARLVLQGSKPVIDALTPTQVSHLSFFSRHIALSCDVPSREEALKIAGDAKKFCSMDASAWLCEVSRLQSMGIKSQTEDVEVQYFALDQGCLCGVANEIMTELALQASRLLDQEFFYLGGYTNGCSGYLPTAEEFDLGGYEVYWSMLVYFPYHGRVFPLQREAAECLVEFVVEQWTNRE